MQENVPHLFGYNIFDYLNVMVLTAFAMEGLLKIIVHGPKNRIFCIFQDPIVSHKCMSRMAVKTSKDTHKSAAELGTP